MRGFVKVDRRILEEWSIIDDDDVELTILAR
jgi:hypothetical protein